MGARAWNDMKSFSTGGTYVNFLTEDESPERSEGEPRERARTTYEIKSRWDPENVFRHEPEHRTRLRLAPHLRRTERGKAPKLLRRGAAPGPRSGGRSRSRCEEPGQDGVSRDERN